MSYLEKLLECVEVEWKTFGEVAKIQRGASPRPIANFITDDINGVPWIKIGDTVPNSKYVENTKQKITPDGAKKSRILKKGDFIMSNSMSYGRPYILDIEGAIHDGWASISDFEDKLNSDFLYHYLSSDIVQDYWLSKINSSSVSNLNADIIKSLQIPIPPIEIQKKIVRILDTFTELTAELTTELTARKQQYNYYRKQLLSFEDKEVEWKTFGEIGEIKRGVAFTKKQAVFGKFPVVANAAGPISFHNEFNRNGEFIVVARSGANAGLISYWNEELFLTDAFSIHPNNTVLNTKFAYYFLKKRQREIHLMKEGSGVPHVRASDFEIYKIPIPSLDEQVRIVKVLDKFDTLINSISEGLPKEIELRKKQYEHYRDLLLTFPKDDM